MKTRTRKPKQNRLKNPVTRVLRTLKRTFLITAVMLFAGGLWYTYTSTSAMFSSRAGKLATYGAGAVFAPAIDTVPWWAWVLGAGIAVYLWKKHKLIMSIVYGAALGLWLAMGGFSL